MLVKVDDPNEFVKRMFFLLWQACGGPSGMGVFQDTPEATEDEVFENVKTAGDYPAKWTKKLYGDYVFGRMMKWGCDIRKDGKIEIKDREYSSDYQGFSKVYGDNKAIVNAAAKSLNIANIKIQ